MKSNCCNAEMTLKGEGMTQFWSCDVCNNSHDLAGNMNFEPPRIIPPLKKPHWVGTPLDPKDHWEYQGSKDTYNSFWKTVITSPQWQAWAKKNRKETRWDIDECEECGWISEEHFQEFLQFIIREFLEIKDITTPKQVYRNEDLIEGETYMITPILENGTKLE